VTDTVTEKNDITIEAEAVVEAETTKEKYIANIQKNP
jgi:hypothetical protein